MPRLPVKVVAAGGGSQPVGRGIGRLSEMVVADVNSSQPIPVGIHEMRAIIQRDLGPAAWFQYQAGITVTGAGVSQWDDQSGNGRHLKQATDTNRPALQADGSILFDGVDNFLKCDAFTLNQPETVYILFKQVTWTDSDQIFDGDVANTMGMRQDGGGVSPAIEILATTAVATNSGLSVGVYGVAAAVFNGASSSLQINHGTATTGNAGALNGGGFTLGSRGTTTSAQFSNIQVKEAILFAAAHDAAQRAAVIAYLRAVGGI